MISQTAGIKEVHVIRIPPGSDILPALRDFVESRDIRSGVILNGIGSATQYRVHVVPTTALPPGDVFFDEKGPFDILNINGFVVDGRVHAHITLSNTQRVMGGYLEEGTLVLTFAIVTLAETEGADIAGWDTIREF